MNRQNYLISGPSGSGKSTVGKALSNRGYKAIETDSEPGLSSWVHNESKKKLGPEDLPSQPYTRDWLDQHKWVWDTTRFKEILSENSDDSMFFVGGAHNQMEFSDYFSVKFAMFVDNTTLIKRLQTREPERWKNGFTEIQNMLDWNERWQEWSSSRSFILINGAQPVNKIADQILSKLPL